MSFNFKRIGHDYLKSLPEEQQDLIDRVMLSTIDMCSEISGEDFRFTEGAMYKAFKWEMLGHMVKDDYYDPVNKVWKNMNEK